MYDADVMVIGAGPAGLASAVAAARRGMRVITADAARPPIDKTCGEGLMPDSQAAAARLGIEVPAAAGFAFRGIRFCLGGTSVASTFPAGYGLGVRRTVLYGHLLEAAWAAGVELRFGVTCTGIDGEHVQFEGSRPVRVRWILGADGQQSRVRKWAELEQTRREMRRYGFRRHYRVAPWSDFMEIHWGNGCQFYVTPVSGDEICLVLMSRDSHLRIDDALPWFPELAQRLPAGAASSIERGAMAGLRLLRRVTRGNVALTGDASGNVDAITGEGLCVAFRQAETLAASMEAGSLDGYERVHRSLMRQPAWMGSLMLALDRFPRLRRRAIPALALRPDLFGDLLAFHVGEMSLWRAASTTAALFWGVICQ